VLFFPVNRLNRMAVERAAAGPHFNKDNGPAIDGDDVDVAPQDPFSAGDDPVAEPA